MMRERLLSSIYSAFDKDPHGQTAFRLRHPDGVAWKVRDRVLTASTEAGAPLAVVGLRDRTMGQVMAELQAAGCTIAYSNPDLVDRAADMLLTGAGRQSQSNGDALQAYDSLLWSMLDAYAVALEDADADIVAAIRQLYLGEAGGEWLEVWGEYFGLPRNDDELDEAYRVRIVVETLRPRVNRLAIEDAIKSTTGNSVALYEPWRDLFILGGSALDGAHHMPDGQFWTHNVAQPTSEKPIDWTPVLALINRSRPVGTIIAPPRFNAHLSAELELDPLQAVKVGVEHVHGGTAVAKRGNRLDAFALGDAEPDIVNYKAAISQLITGSNSEPLANSAPIDAGRRNIRRANIVLSDSDPVGAINAVLPRSYWIQPEDDMRLSGTSALSHYDGRIRLGMVNEIRTLFALSLAFSDFGGAVVTMGITETRVIGPVECPLPVEQLEVGIEFVNAEIWPVSEYLNPTAAMWGFSGAGAWAQDSETGWEENVIWGNGLPQS